MEKCFGLVVDGSQGGRTFKNIIPRKSIPGIKSVKEFIHLVLVAAVRAEGVPNVSSSKLYVPGELLSVILVFKPILSRA